MVQPAPSPPSSSKFDPIAGRVVLGRYRIIRPLGRGGTGVVYLGRTEGSAGFSKPVVIKRLLPNLVKDPKHVKMLIREARILANLKHSGIVGVVDLGEEDDAYLMVLEYVHGYDLGHWLKFLRHRSRRLPIDVVLEISTRVLDALHYAHSLKKPDGSSGSVIHRDISPSNILLDVDGNVRLLDFGIAHVTDELADPDTKKNSFKGKVGYSHPSLLKFGTPSAITDTYSAAVVTLQMLIGVNPFYAESTAATVDRVVNKPLPKLRDFVADAPPELEQILLRALSRDHQENYRSAHELAEALQTQRTQSSSAASALLLDLVQADFSGDMPAALQLEPLEERDAAWRSFAVTHADGLRRMSRSPESGEPTVVARRPTHGVPAPEEPTTLAGQGSLAAPLNEIAARGTSRRRSLRAAYFWLIGGLAFTLLALSVVLLVQRNAESSDSRPLTWGGEPGTGTRLSATVAAAAPSSAAASYATTTDVHDDITPSHMARREPTSQHLTQVFSRNQRLLQLCFAQVPAAAQAVGTVEIAFEVDTSGNVVAANVSPSSVAATPLGTCLLDVARRTAFGALTRTANFRVPVRASARDTSPN